MKKLITLSLFCFILSSCKDDNVVVIQKDEYNKLKGISPVKSFKVGNKPYELTTASDSCEYYSMKVGAGGYAYNTQYFHYPQCSHCKIR